MSEVIQRELVDGSLISKRTSLLRANTLSIISPRYDKKKIEIKFQEM